MRNMNKPLLGILAALGMCLGAAQMAAAEDLVIIANNSVKAADISQSEAREVFLGDSNSVGGSKVTPVLLHSGPAQDAFLKLVGKSGSGVEATWRKQVFTGKGSMPHGCASEEAMIVYVGSTPGAIGYVSSNKSLSGVKVLELK
jgi:ABC-type phosphate transport system substrate-binding protein